MTTGNILLTEHPTTPSCLMIAASQRIRRPLYFERANTSDAMRDALERRR